MTGRKKHEARSHKTYRKNQIPVSLNRLNIRGQYPGLNFGGLNFGGLLSVLLKRAGRTRESKAAREG
jgi:hypothetical protein